MKNIGILLPAYNEERNIKIVLREAKRFLPNAVVIVVDDGSSDRTSKIAKSEGVHVIVHKENKGKGEALRSGLEFLDKKMSGIKYIVVADADRQYTIAEAPKVLKPLIDNSADFVMGYRDFSGVPFRHRLGNFVWKTVFNILFGTRLKDTNCGFIAMKKEVAQAVIKVVGGGYIIENSLLIEAMKKKFRITQVKVSVRYKKTSAIRRGLRTVLGVLVFILDKGIKYRLGR
ncbi:MAG: glycosyltransferase family 2 protein [Candidatus Aenigmatarchaeota archaeon]